MKQTSIDAYREIRETLPLSQLRVFNALARQKMTGAELNEYLQTHSAHKRLRELQRRGAIFEQGTRQCRITGMTAIEWGTEQPNGQLSMF